MPYKKKNGDQGLQLTEYPLKAKRLVMSESFKLEKEDGDLYSDSEYDMPGYSPPRSFKNKDIPRTSSTLNAEEAERTLTAKKNLIETHKILVDAGAALGLNLCRIYKENRVEHMLSEIVPGEKECPICKRECSSTAVLRTHMNQHLVEPRFQCELCSKGFGEKQSLKRHVRLHKKGIKLPVCEICGKTFDTIGHKNQHKKSHTEVYKCKHCEKVLTTKKGLGEHEYKCPEQEGGMPPRTQCPHCVKTFVDKKQTNRHISGAHPGKLKIGEKVKTG